MISHFVICLLIVCIRFGDGIYGNQEQGIVAQKVLAEGTKLDDSIAHSVPRNTGESSNEVVVEKVTARSKD